MKKDLIGFILIVLFLFVYATSTHTINGILEITDSNTKSFLYQSGDSLFIKSHDSTFIPTSTTSMGSHHILNDTTHCTSANVYYKVQGTWVNGTSCNFETDGISKLTYKGNYSKAVVIGVSDLVCSDNTAVVTYGFYKNNTLVTGWETPTTFENVTNYQHISITGILPIKKNDYIEIWCKSDKAGTIITHKTIMISMICDR